MTSIIPAELLSRNVADRHFRYACRFADFQLCPSRKAIFRIIVTYPACQPHRGGSYRPIACRPFFGVRNYRHHALNDVLCIISRIVFEHGVHDPCYVCADWFFGMVRTHLHHLFAVAALRTLEATLFSERCGNIFRY